MRNLFFANKGFTLTEMMAVVVIVSILMAVVMGTFRSSLEKARFQEGFQAAEAVSAALERYYYDNPDLSETERLKVGFDALDIGLSSAQACAGGITASTCRKIHNFEVQIVGLETGEMLGTSIPLAAIAYRGTAPTAAGGSYQYKIIAIPSLSRELYKGTDTTTGNEIKTGGSCSQGPGQGSAQVQRAQDLCFTMGYTQKCSNLSERAEPGNATQSDFCKP